MLDILKVIPENERNLMTKYVESYARPGSADENREYEFIMNDHRFTDVKHRYRFWAIEKEPLYNHMGGNLILKVPFSYEKDFDILRREMRDTIIYASNPLNIRNVANIDIAANFYKILVHKIADYSDVDIFSNTYSYLIDMFALTKNRYEGDNTAIILHNDNCEVTKTIKLQKGCKITRVYEQIAKFFGVEGYEQFRLVHSAVLNQKKLTGTLCISIHPMDYMTMSDNDCDWESCMSWTGNGCYRLGSVEMMNSSCVVICYIESDTPYYICGQEWTNKKWRQLFIITEDIITGIKSYPYFNEGITNACLDELKKIMPYEYSDEPVRINRGRYANNEVDLTFNGEVHKEVSVAYEFSTDYMYNDIECGGGGEAYKLGYAYIGKSMLDKQHTRVGINYSGQPECMWCGGEYHLDGEETLVCWDCYEREERCYCHCAECGDDIYNEEDCYYVDGVSLCEDCYNNYTVSCANDYGENHLEQNTFQVAVLDKDRNMIAYLEDEWGSSAHFYIGGYRYSFFKDFLKDNSIHEYYAASSYNSVNHDYFSSFTDSTIFIPKDNEEVINSICDEYSVTRTDDYYTPYFFPNGLNYNYRNIYKFTYHEDTGKWTHKKVYDVNNPTKGVNGHYFVDFN